MNVWLPDTYLVQYGVLLALEWKICPSVIHDAFYKTKSSLNWSMIREWWNGMDS